MWNYWSLNFNFTIANHKANGLLTLSVCVLKVCHGQLVFKSLVGLIVLLFVFWNSIHNVKFRCQNCIIIKKHTCRLSTPKPLYVLPLLDCFKHKLWVKCTSRNIKQDAHGPDPLTFTRIRILKVIDFWARQKCTCFYTGYNHTREIARVHLKHYHSRAIKANFRLW